MKKNILKFVLLLVAAVFANVALATQPAVFINPGHGGHASDDRNVAVPPFAAGDTAGYWESNSNLYKGLNLAHILRLKGYKVTLSRVTNTEDDDLDLSTIVALSNASGADVFYAIHSNATGTGSRCNFPIALYRGYTGQPQSVGSDTVSALLEPHLYGNKTTYWTNNYAIYGDWTFYPDWHNQGLGVLRGNTLPAMLSEGSFHDYIPETYRLLNLNYCWLEAWNFSLAADDYLKQSGYDKGAVAGNLRDTRLLRVVDYLRFGDDQRLPINGAMVYLIDANGTVVDSCATDSLNNGIYVFKYVAPGTYKVRATDSKHYEQTKDITVTANQPTYCNFDLDRVRDTPPQVTSYSPVWKDGDAAVLCNTPVVLNFNWDMDAASTEPAFSITPAVEGTLKWEDSNYRLVFTPNDAYDVNTVYTVKLAKSAKHGGGTSMNDDFSFRFKTQSRSHLGVLAVFPSDGDQVHYKSASVELRVDSMLSTTEFYNNIVVTDSAGNVLAYNRRSVKSTKAGDPYGYIRIPLATAMTVGGKYKLSISNVVADTVGIHLAKALEYNFTAVDAGAAKEGSTVAQAFETDTVYSVNTAASSDYTTAKLSGSSTCLFGSKSLQLDYTFAAQDKGKIHCDLSAPGEVAFVSTDYAGLHIYGDMSYNALYGVFSSGSDTKVVKLSDITYLGWRYVSVPLTALSAGVNYHFTGFEIAKNNSVMGLSGTVRFDNLLKALSSGVDEIQNSTVKVSPNPASNYIVASADGLIDGMELISLSGQTIARNAGNFINVSEVASGMYIVKVFVGGTTSVHKVMVSHK